MAATTSARQADHAALASLPTRPPTPPKETSSRTSSAPIKTTVRQSLTKHQSLQTPPSIHSLVSPATTESNPGSGLRKKVEWSAHTEYKDAPQYLEGERLAKSSPLAAGTAPRPIKGILKASSSPCQPSSLLNTRLGSLTEQISISDMLDSTIKQLSGSDRDSKVDAYMALARALKTSNNLPDRVALQGKLSLLTQFIQRDITLKNSNGALDRSLVNHALLLLTTFLHFNAIASAISFDFAIFITDHAIRSFEDPNMPKEVVRYLMQVMAFQSFAPKVMSSDRVGRLVTAIHKLEGHLSGKSIVMSRIQLYRRLVKQCPHHMVAHASWLQDLFTDMLSLTKDIRTEATTLGLEAGFQIRHDKQVLRHVLEILQAETDDKSFIQYYIERLQEMLKDRERSAAVPQIWAVVNLFMRCPLERWELYGPWLTVVQTAFNTADGVTKLEANYAWNRYVYLCLSEGKLTSKSLTTLCQPLLSQLRKKANPKNPEEIAKLRRTAIGGACNLFYYSFRPGNDRLSPDMIWDVAVHPILSQLLALSDNNDASGDSTLQAARLLNGLLDGATPRVWREDRITETSLVRPDELPPLDPKWIRRNSEKVFKILDSILERKVLDLANQDSLAYRLWQSLVGAIAAASAKDIKVSDDTVKFFAGAFGLLYKIWSKGAPSSQADSSRMLKGVHHLVQIMINGLGVLPFTEKRLSMTTQNLFEAIATPSARIERHDKSFGVVRSPLLHLLNLFSTIPEGAADDDDFSAFILTTFEPFFSGKSEKARLDQTRDLLRALPRSVSCPYGVWILASQNLVLPFIRPTTDDEKGDKILGPEYREMISFLERGLTCHPNLPLDGWLSTFKSVDDHVGHNFGQAGRVLVVFEPVAKFLVDLIECDQPQLIAPSFFSIMANLLACAQWPKDKQAMDAARRHLWGAAPPASQHGPFKPFEILCKAADLAMNKAYQSLAVTTDIAPISSLLSSLTAFITASSEHEDVVLSALQIGLQTWIADESGLFSLDTDSEIGQAAKQLWSEICRALVNIGRPCGGQLGTLEPLLSSGCESKHHVIRTMAAETWNRMVDQVDEPQCSDSLKTILSTMSSKLDMEMAAPVHPSNWSGAQLRVSLTRQDSFDLPKSNPQASSVLSKRGTPVATPSPPKTSLLTRAQSRKKEEAISRRTRNRGNKRTGTPRLRHDSSQIEFTAVASSSPLGEESQHLTERQKEVRERQKADAAAWAKPASDEPMAEAPRPEQSNAVALDHGPGTHHPEETTPEPRTSYEDLISSTPTPRRGQVLQMDDLNDPPSSPPELRPYPLLSEIRTRSRAKGSLEGWEFSSPPNSPSLNDPAAALRNASAEASKPQIAGHLTDQGGLSNEMILLSRGRAVMKQESTSAHETDKPKSSEVSQSQQEEESPQIQTRTRRNKRKSARSKDSDNASPAVDTSSKRTLRSQSQDDLTQVNSPRKGDASFCPSEDVESNMLPVIVALKSKTSDAIKPHSPARTRKHTKLSPPISDSIPHTPGSERSLRGHTIETRKRKNEELKQESLRRKRVKPSPHDESQQANGSSPAYASCSPGDKMRTRRSKRVRREPEQQQDENENEETMCEPTTGSMDTNKANDEAGDTDEELLSQLMADSQAASLNQSQSRQADGTTIDPGQADEMQADDATTAVLSLLRSGKDMLRGKAINRAQVDELETMIMDLKREIYQAEYRGREP